MRDVAERAGVHDRRLPLGGLHQARLERILQQHHHRPDDAERAGAHGRAVFGPADDDVREPLTQVVVARRERDDRHDLRGRGDVESGVAERPVRPLADAGDDATERAVLGVRHAPPADPVGPEAGHVAGARDAVGHRRQEVVCGLDRVEVAGEVQVDVGGRLHGRRAAARTAALATEQRAERGLAHREHGALADPCEPVREPDGGRGLALSGGCGRDRRDDHELAASPVRGNRLQRHLDLVAPQRLDRVPLDPQLLDDIGHRSHRDPLHAPAGGYGIRSSMRPASGPHEPSPCSTGGGATRELQRAPKRLCPSRRAAAC